MSNKKYKKNKRDNLRISLINTIKRISRKREKEYSKRLLNRIVNSSILMMIGTYVLAWYGKVEVAETLSKTIATSIISVVVGYLVKSVIENISKNTTTFGENVRPNNTDEYNSDEMNRDC